VLVNSVPSTASSTVTAPPLHRIMLIIQYDGQSYNGWQSQPQPHIRTIQTTLEKALNQFAANITLGLPPIEVVCAGRTDAGVHASCQVVHFDTPLVRKMDGWVRGTNTYLPPSIRVIHAQVVNPDFHARFSATSRTYHYWIYNQRVASALWQGKAGWYHATLDITAMQQGATYLLGEHDFSSFRSSECQARSPIRHIDRLTVEQYGIWIKIAIHGNAFLHHMVRNIVGSLIHIGNGNHDPEWMMAVLEAKDRSVAAPTFMPDGLYLVGVGYPHQFQLPLTLLQPLAGQTTPAS
jgi:tRNA pseudouridine38-40 synthase